MTRILSLSGVFALIVTGTAYGQLAPAIGYMFPPGGQAGTSVEVTLGGYDWTPDMQIFVHDPRITLELLGPPGPIIVPEPPYWFGKKARRPPFLLPRETKARLTIPADVPSGLIGWQVANANGASAVGQFVVGGDPQVIETDGRREPQIVKSLPIVVAGQIKHIEEVDEYRITATKSGPITCTLCSRKIGTELNAVLEVKDVSGNPVASTADSAGHDTALTFHGESGQSYLLRLYDLDFRGNRAFVYRLRIAEEPRVIAALPPAGRRGETWEVEFIGYGIASGQAKLESVKTAVTFPEDSNSDSFNYVLETPYGNSAPIALSLSNGPENIRPEEVLPMLPALPAAVSAMMQEPTGEHRYHITAKKGDMLAVEVAAEKFGSVMDVSLAIYDVDGKVRGQNDDLPGTVDAGMSFKVPADGEYQIAVSDISGQTGHPAAIYRLSVQQEQPGFALEVPGMLNIPLGGAGKITLKATRSGGLQDPIQLSLLNLPEGVTAPKDLTIPAGKTAQTIDLTVAADAAASASLVKIIGEVVVDGQTLKQVSGPVLIAATITPPFSVDAEGQDDVTKWPRGTIFPAPVLIERQPGFEGEIVLEMTSKQGRHRQGITGPDLIVPPGVQRILYPVTLPEWLETTRTSRMVVNGVAKIADPKGNVRYSVSRQKTRLGFLPTGALLKLSAEPREFSARVGQAVSIPITISRSAELTSPTRVELRLNNTQTGRFATEVQTLSAQTTAANFPIILKQLPLATAEEELTIRATVFQAGNLPVVSETKVRLLYDFPRQTTIR